MNRRSTSPRHRAALARACACLAAVFAVAGCSRGAAESVAAESAPAAPRPACAALETRAPEARGQTPAFVGQTRACGVDGRVAFDVTVVARGLDHPWSVEPLGASKLEGFLVSERPGRLRFVAPNGELGSAIEGLPAVDARGQGGLLDVALSPRFAQDRTIFWSFSEPRQGGNGTSVARGVLSADRRRLEQVAVVFRALPTYAGALHFGSRLLFGPDGFLYVTLGERSDRSMRKYAQQLDSHLGKIVRLRFDGIAGDSAAPGNPFAGQAGVLPEIWSIGHRNIQAAVFDRAGQLWEIEHGAQGGDELNRIVGGKNYGWPVQAYGEEYSGLSIGGAQTAREGMEQPVYYWDPVIAPSGAEIYTGTAFPAWQGSLFVGALREHRLVRLALEGDRVVGEEHLLAERGQRIRDVRQGPDGFLYLVTDETRGELWRLSPAR
jgi:glucose/arabinose dehydrogenase